jgi:hypothetical protein
LHPLRKKSIISSLLAGGFFGPPSEGGAAFLFCISPRFVIRVGCAFLPKIPLFFFVVFSFIG